MFKNLTLSGSHRDYIQTLTDEIHRNVRLIYYVELIKIIRILDSDKIITQLLRKVFNFKLPIKNKGHGYDLYVP